MVVTGGVFPGSTASIPATAAARELRVTSRVLVLVQASATPGLIQLQVIASGLAPLTLAFARL